MFAAVCSGSISPTNGPVYASPSWINRGAASREENIILYTHSTHMNAGNMLGGVGKQKRNGCLMQEKEEIQSIFMT